MRMLAAALLALTLGACAQTSGVGPDAPASYLTGTSWRRVDDTNANPHGATMAFSADRASGYTGCNNWFASVTHDGESLRFDDVGMTRRACDGAGVQVDTERNFLAVIEATRYAHYDQDALMLLDENQQVIAEFRTE